MTMTKNLRQLHRFLAPVMLLPIVLTVITGTLFQLGEMLGQEERVEWVLDIHKGNFGIIDLQTIYPFLNSLGLLLLVATGIVMWLQPKRRFQKRLNS
jgi:cytochrome b subunit of formate dehydrogenase